MEPWLDSLSEDWKSQSHSSPASLPDGTPSPSERSSVLSIGSRSRIPLAAPRSSQGPANRNGYLRTRSSKSVSNGEGGPVLAERTSSKLNAAAQQAVKGGSVKLNGKVEHTTSSTLPRRMSRSFSETSSQSVQHHTRRLSSGKESARDGTPEWRRRLVRGDVPVGEQCELFGPIGLENVFKPPITGQKKDVGTATSHENTKPWSIADVMSTNKAPELGPPSMRASTLKKPGMEVVEEESEEASIKSGASSVPVHNPGNEDGDGDRSQSSVPDPSAHLSSLSDIDGPAHVSSDSTLDRAASAEQPVPPNEHAASTDDARLRTVSGQEEVRNEGISPIIVSRQSTAEGQIDYAAMHGSIRQLQNKLGKLDLGKDERPGSSDTAIHYGEGEVDLSVAEVNHLDDLTSQSLPEDLSMGTQDFVSNGGFVTIRRGGFSNEGSFQRRNLSPSSLPSHRQSSVGPSSSQFRSSPPPLTLSKASQRTENTPPAAPTPPVTLTPPQNHSRENRSPDKSKSLGSPLKLFGNYDTFTSNKLIRRMSQFEETLEESSDDDNAHPERGSSKKAEDEVRAKSKGKPPDFQPQAPDIAQLATRSEMNEFGRGQLDHFGFKEGLPKNGSPSNEFGEDPSLAPMPKLRRASDDRNPFMQPHSRSSGVEGREAPPDEHAESNSKGVIRPELNLGIDKISSRKQRGDVQGESIECVEGKRALNSPVKDPTPKRRRTLQKLEIEIQLNQQRPSSESYVEFQTAAGRKRKDARYDENGKPADPKILAMRQILRPRTPTPSQSGSQASKHSQIQVFAERQSDEIVFVQNDFGSKTDAVAEELASFGVDIAQRMAESRKGSMTTQDFVQEATKIMDIIRAKGRPSHGLNSVEESESEYMAIEQQAYLDESTMDEFSRPPSRDGADMRKVRETRQEDPRILSHLRKFEEKDDSEIDINTSMASLHLQDDIKTMQPAQDASQKWDANGFHSSPSNIRIRENPIAQRKRKHSNSTIQEEQSGQQGTEVQTQSSSGTSTGRSIPTGSSGSSGPKGMIPSEKVAHLIPQQVGGMMYDRSKRTWVKGRKSKSPDGLNRRVRGHTTDDDPFQDIPDLSVDEIEELRKKTSASGLGLPMCLVKSREAEDRLPTHDNTTYNKEEAADSRPHTREGGLLMPSDTSSAQSKFTRLESSGPKVETRATSWSTNEPDMKAQARHQELAANQGSHLHSEEVEHEIRIHEGRISTVPNRSDADGRQPRAVTIAFSSPLVSHIGYQNDVSISEDSQMRNHALDDIVIGANDSRHVELELSHHDTPLRRQSGQMPPLRVISRRASIEGRGFPARPVSRIDEQDEDSVNHETSVVPSNAVMTPHPGQSSAALALPPTTGRRSNISFYLSPLQEFTVNQVDESVHLEVSYVAQRQHHSSLRQVHGTFALAVEDLIKRITDVEPYEPYWEHLRRLDLKGKDLITLHRLQDFCSRIEELDVSINQIGQLSGIPSSIRNLRIQRNCLSNLTAWGHLSNLQYLDVSGNELDNLDGFSNLIHLRELRANNNKIASIDGILDLDGLLSLKLRGNQLEAVDFKGAELTRLNDLDLSGNKLSSVRNIHFLPALEQVALDDNDLHGLFFDTSTPLRTLSSLTISNNHLHALDITALPSLYLLYLDKNHISTITGLQNSRTLDTLSLREQSPSSSSADSKPGLNINLSHCHDLRKLYLSSNTTLSISPTTLTPTLPLLNLQYLDLSSCGLSTMPPDFGRKVPNIRVLNLNFNAINDIRPLIGIVRLSKLLLSGNRVGRLRRTCMVLRRLAEGGSLKELDLRGNPLTVGFYAPAPLPPRDDRVVLRRQHEHNSNEEKSEEVLDPYVLPDADADADKKYTQRLDEGTKLRRRVQELLLAAMCPALVRLDGLGFERGEVGRRDGVWRRLEALGVLKKKKGVGKERDGDVVMVEN